MNYFALIAQLDRALDYGSKGWGFESLWAYHLKILVKSRSSTIW